MGDIQSTLLKNLSCTHGRSHLAKPLERLKILQTLSCLLALLHPSQQLIVQVFLAHHSASKAGRQVPTVNTLAYVTFPASQRSTVPWAGLGNNSPNSSQRPYLADDLFLATFSLISLDTFQILQQIEQRNAKAPLLF